MGNKTKKNVTATAVVFRTAYECTQSHLSFREHERLIDLQSVNGLACGEMLYSHHACANIIKHIANCPRQEIAEYVVSRGAKFSLMIDESTSVSNVQSLIVYLRVVFEDTVCTYFTGLLPLTTASAAAIYTELTVFLSECGLTTVYLPNSLSVYASMVLLAC